MAFSKKQRRAISVVLVFIGVVILSSGLSHMKESYQYNYLLPGGAIVIPGAILMIGIILFVESIMRKSSQV